MANRILRFRGSGNLNTGGTMPTIKANGISMSYEQRVWAIRSS